MKIKNYLKIKNWKLKIAFCALFVFLYSVQNVSAATINKPTNYLGMIGYWTFDGKDMTPNVRDVSGNGNHAFLSAGLATTTVIGQIGQGIQLSGGSTQIDIPDMVEGLAQVTVATWVRVNDVSGLQNYIIEQVGAGSDPFQLDYGTGTGGNDYRYRCGVDTGAGSVTTNYSAGQITDKKWHHVACVYDGVDIRLYVDGVLKVTPVAQTGTLASTATDLHIGGDSLSLTGDVDDFRIYNRGLSASEIQQLYNKNAADINKSSLNKISGLVGRWTFDGANASTTITDTSGSGYNGYFIGGATSTAKTIGKIGQALKFDGVDDYINIGDINQFETEPFSVSAWFYSDNASDGTIFSSNDSEAYSGSATDRFALEVSGGKLQAMAHRGTVGGAAQSATTIQSGRWYHGVAVFESDTARRLYVDGVQVASNASNEAVGAGSNQIRIGAARDSGATYLPWKGKIDDVQIFNRALTTSEIKQIYNESQSKVNKSPTGKNTSGLVGYWTFDGANASTTITDTSGSGNNGYFIGGATSTAKTIGKIGQALKFDGVDDYVRVSNPGSILDNTNLTTSAWVFYSTDQSGGGGFPRIVDRGYADQFSVYINSSSNRLAAALNTTGTDVDASTLCSSNSIQAGAWNFITVTYDGETLIGYVNGAQCGTSTTPSGGLANSTSNLIIGERTDAGASRVLNGSVDDLRIYNRVLSETEVKRLYNQLR